MEIRQMMCEDFEVRRNGKLCCVCKGKLNGRWKHITFMALDGIQKDDLLSPSNQSFRQVGTNKSGTARN